MVYTLEPLHFGNLISQSRGSPATDSFYHFDAMGSTRQLTNSVRTITDVYLYDSFGNVINGGASGTTTNPFQYVGRQGYYADTELGMYCLRARTYDPGSGRFLSKDRPPSRAKGPRSLYVYADGDPANLIDPSGLSSVPISIPIGVVVGYCVCESKRNKHYRDYGGAILTPAQEDCINKAFRVVAGTVAGKSGYFAANFGGCQDNTWAGTSPGGITGVFCGPCPNIVLIQKGVASACDSCNSFVTLLANVVHECRHFKQSACSWGSTPTDTSPENDAANFTIGFFSNMNAVRICDQLVGMGVCSTPFECYDELSREINDERGEITS